jgi:prepilin-type N-terminal cleavage/methylation domain-containing protein
MSTPLANPPRCLRRPGFSLVELLVVLGVIAVLIGILLPVLNNVRGSGQRVACRAQLADIGRFFQMYLNDSKGKLPWVNPVPSIQPPIDGKPLVEVFEPYVRGAKDVWRCRLDAITRQWAGAPTGFETYFAREGTSYLYNPMLAQLYRGRMINDHPLYKSGKQNQLAVFWEFEPFHGKPDTRGSMNYLFADMHVGDLADE